MNFGFRMPKYDPSLSEQANAAIATATLASRLAVENRTVVYNTDGRPENVAEHSAMLAIVAPALAEEFFPDLNSNLVARYAAIHDTVEAYAGDTPTHIITKEEMAAKAKREAAGLEQLKQEYAHLPKFVAIIGEYEAQQVPEARFVRMVDKLMPALVHLNDGGRGLIEFGYTPEMIRQNSAERASQFRQEYPDMELVISLREELSERIAELLATK